jgi:hypothetical protein
MFTIDVISESLLLTAVRGKAEVTFGTAMIIIISQ